MGFLSASALTSKGNNRKPYTLAEDQIICNGLEEGESASQIVDSLQGEGFDRTVLSVRYRITTLRDAAGKYESLEDFHAKKAKSESAAPAPVINEIEEVEEDEVDDMTAKLLEEVEA